MATVAAGSGDNDGGGTSCSDGAARLPSPIATSRGDGTTSRDSDRCTCTTTAVEDVAAGVPAATVRPTRNLPGDVNASTPANTAVRAGLPLPRPAANAHPSPPPVAHGLLLRMSALLPPPTDCRPPLVSRFLLVCPFHSLPRCFCLPPASHPLPRTNRWWLRWTVTA